MSDIPCTIGIIGSGRVGRTVGGGLKQLGHRVLFHDVDESTVEGLKKLGHEATLDIRFVINHSCLSFICVPTSSPQRTDLSCLISAVTSAAHALKDKPDYYLIVIKSTIVPTTTERVIIPLLKNSGKTLRKELGICVNPEFGTEAATTWTNDPQYHRDFLSQDRIIIGELDKNSGEVLEQLYKPLQKPIFRTDLRTAEMVKYAANLMLATKVSFWNEVFLVCQKLGIDSRQVADIAALDPRIGKYGSVHGKAFGGKCLPKDLEGFISFALKYHSPALLKAVKRVNDYMSHNYGIRE